MKIAILDNYIPKSYTKELNIVENLVVNDDYKVVERRIEEHNYNDHGINVARILNKYAPKAKIISIQIFDDESMGKIEKLLAALEYCYRENINLINMSVGTSHLCDSFLMEDIISKLYQNGQIVVAAQSNDKLLSFPATFGSVISVRSAERGKAQEEILYNWNDDIYCKSKHELMDRVIGVSETIVSNSYATPFVTASIYNLLSNYPIQVNEEIYRSDCIAILEMPIVTDSTIIVTENKERLDLDGIYLPIVSFDELSDVPLSNKDIILYNESGDDCTSNNLFVKDRIIDRDIKSIYFLGLWNRELVSDLKKYYRRVYINPTTEIYPDKYRRSQYNGCPQIRFYGDEKYLFSIVRGLRDAFMKERFNAFGYTDSLEGTFFGLYYFKNTVSEKRLFQLREIFEPEVELVYSRAGKYGDCDGLVADVFVEYDCGSYFVDIIDNGNWKQVCGMKKSIINKIYDSIVD